MDRINLRAEADDGWQRKLEMNIPVFELDQWSKNKGTLIDLLNFLTGDIWIINFRKRNLYSFEEKIREKYENERKQGIDIDEICMFSGGLDSFIGAIDILEVDKKTLFVSHYGGGKGSKEYQDILRENLIKEYSISTESFCSFFGAARNAYEDTTRSRSLMFFSHAIAIATAFKKNISIIIPENGLISLNVPLTNSRLGSSSTRTTHPYYLKLLQQIINAFDRNINLQNPYRFFTKGEMINNCKNIQFLKDNITNTMSCSHPDHGRMNGESEPCHCGNCYPCIIRKSAIDSSVLKDKTKYRNNDTPTSKMNYNTYNLALEKFNDYRAFLLIQTSGPVEEDIEQYKNIYVRGMKELHKYLRNKD